MGFLTNFFYSDREVRLGVPNREVGNEGGSYIQPVIALMGVVAYIHQKFGRKRGYLIFNE